MATFASMLWSRTEPAACGRQTCGEMTPRMGRTGWNVILQMLFIVGDLEPATLILCANVKCDDLSYLLCLEGNCEYQIGMKAF